MFYVLLALAALTSTISLHEVVTAFLHEEFNLTRGRALWSLFGCISSFLVMQKYTWHLILAKILLTLLFIFMCIWVLFPVKEESLEQDQEGIEEIKNFLAGVHEMEEKESLRYSMISLKRREVVLAAFDPNSADSIEFLQRGLSPFIAHTILQYRRAGGKFRTADDFSRVYGLSSEKFNMLKPYIQISEAFRRKQDTLHFIKKAEKDTLAVYKYPEGTLVDLNEADTTELKKIPGIGSGIARMIVAYRKRLGGFYDMAQLKEVNYVDEDMLRWFKLGNAPIHRINANKAGLDQTFALILI